MKSNSKNVQFRPLEEVLTGKIIQTDPLVWKPKVNGFPYWYKPFAKATIIHPMFTPRALNDLERTFGPSAAGAFAIQPSQYTVTELRARANPWHPSGRLDTLTLRRHDGWRDITLVLKFHQDEAIQCVSVFTETKAPPKIESKYKGPRLSNDTKSAVSGNAKKR